MMKGNIPVSNITLEFDNELCVDKLCTNFDKEKLRFCTFSRSSSLENLQIARIFLYFPFFANFNGFVLEAQTELEKKFGYFQYVLP